ncbi:MAG: hypothetical protein ACOY3L_03750 [Pseudomonadota bacterium]
MPESRPGKPAIGSDGAMRRADQEARLAAELRRNLLRRKQQQRARAEDREPSPAAATTTAETDRGH